MKVNDLNQQPTRADVTLDDLVAMVEKAARTIESLQSEVRRQAGRIAELEQSEASLRKDAAWTVWFRQKYNNSLFYEAVEKTYLQDHIEANTVPASTPTSTP